MFRCCIDVVLDADDNAFKTVLICVSNPCQGTTNYKTPLFSNKSKLLQNPKQMYNGVMVVCS